MEGKSIRCPKCHREFIMRVERPLPVEAAAIRIREDEVSSAAAARRAKAPSDDGKATRARRSKSEIRAEIIDEIKKNIRTYHVRLNQINSQETSSEEEVRRWCVDVLRHVLGYEDLHIDTEMKALNQRIDIALKDNESGKVFMVIECKNIRHKLGTAVRDQAIMYAVNKSADWAVITNGQIWKLYRVFPVKGSDPKAIEVFDIALLDEDGASSADAERFYLLTQRALFKGDSEKQYHKICCLSHQRVLSAMLSPRVIHAIRRALAEGYRGECDEVVHLRDEMVSDKVREMFMPADL